jgi:hypothetical protein
VKEELKMTIFSRFVNDSALEDILNTWGSDYEKVREISKAIKLRKIDLTRPTKTTVKAVSYMMETLEKEREYYNSVRLLEEDWKKTLNDAGYYAAVKPQYNNSGNK